MNIISQDNEFILSKTKESNLIGLCLNFYIIYFCNTFNALLFANLGHIRLKERSCSTLNLSITKLPF